MICSCGITRFIAIDSKEQEGEVVEGLGSIPWHSLRHAYGTAEDVPDLIRQLQTADPNTRGEDSPLWRLFGNIWHQGTVYEATSHAVPFLIQLVETTSTPDRVGILDLLAHIAHGSSYLDVHESFLQRYPVAKPGIPGTEDFEREKRKELEWVEAARTAVIQGYDIYVHLLQSQSDVAYAAANVLACLRIRRAATSRLLAGKLREEARPLYRAGILLLLGELGHESPHVFDAVHSAASSESIEERRAVAITAVRLKTFDITDDFREALVEAICDTDLYQYFEGLPWDTADNIDQSALFHRDDAASKAA
ncbi:MAG: hypothetical protein KDA96_27000, partial [Planctomycetaceae bacterium]|nr:hypothetical protein [Planctomycetaceae bacterium]